MWQRLRCFRRGARRYKNKDKDDDAEDWDPLAAGSSARPAAAAPADAAEGSVLLAARRLAAVYFSAPGKRREALSLGMAVLVLQLVETGVGVRYSNVQKDFMTALEAKNMDGFYAGLRATGVLIIFMLPVILTHGYVGDTLQLRWRRALSARLAKAYLAGETPGQNAFYRLSVTGELDNPDQRIGQDAAEFVEIAYNLVQAVTGTSIAVLGFSIVLFKISPGVCLGVLVYACLGTAIATLVFGPTIMRCQNEVVQREAALRYTLIRARENAESIAFFKGGFAEWSHFDALFSGLVETMQRLILANAGLNTFNHAFMWATFAVAPLLVGPKYARGEVEFGTIAQVSMAFNTVLKGLGLVVSRLGTLTSFCVKVRRLESLEAALLLEERRAREALAGGSGSTCIASNEVAASSSGAVVLQVSRMTLRTPPRVGVVQQTLVQNLSLVVSGGQSILIAGQSGIGKSSLLRAVAGLWNDGCGQVSLARASCFFMPQKPYMFVGSLREQLLYPRVDRLTVSNEELADALRTVNLAYLLEHHSLADTKEWANMLSLGEQQRINFARILLQPGIRLALIDEGTSACDPSNEAHIYSLLGQRLQSYVSVGHRPALRKFHTHALWLRRPSSSKGPAEAAIMAMPDFEQAARSHDHE